jgi:ribosomal protein S19
MTATLRLTRKWGERSFDAADEQVVSFWCRSQLIWPMYIASLIKPDLWISLRRA